MNLVWVHKTRKARLNIGPCASLLSLNFPLSHLPPFQVPNLNTKYYLCCSHNKIKVQFSPLLYISSAHPLKFSILHVYPTYATSSHLIFLIIFQLVNMRVLKGCNSLTQDPAQYRVHLNDHHNS